MLARVVKALVVATLVCTSEAWIQCGSGDGGDGAANDGVQCPDGNTCCPSTTYTGGWACLPNEFPGTGTCCSSSDTGCAHGYLCSNAAAAAAAPAAAAASGATAPRLDCTAMQPLNHPLAKTTPRYQLCSPPAGTLASVHGIAVPVEGADSVSTTEQLAYYSTVGALQLPGDTVDNHRPRPAEGTNSSSGGGSSSVNSTTAANIKAVAIILHGANRNADDYFCAGCSAAALQQTY
eukprot:gene29754-24927_t